MTQILPEHSQNWKSRPGWTLAGAGAAVAGPVPARSWQRGRAPPRGAASSGGAGRCEQAESGRGGARRVPEQRGTGRRRRRRTAAAVLGGRGGAGRARLSRGQGHGSREDGGGAGRPSFTRRPAGT